MFTTIAKIFSFFLPDHLRQTPGSNKIIFTTCLSGHRRNKTFSFFFFLCKYYTTVLEQNICYASPKPNCHLFMLISFFLVFFFSFELFIFCATRSKQRVTKNQENPLKTLKDKIFLSCLLDRLHFGPRWFPFGNMSTEQTCHGLWLSYMESHSGQWGRYALCWCFCLEDNMLDV